MTDATVWLARRWARRTDQRSGVAGFVASRLISRRREGALVILPLTAALAIAVFSLGVYGAAADWRFSNAVTQAGSGQTYRSPLTLDDTVELTHDIDPDGDWLMAAGAEADATFGDRLVLDTPRLARVATWPSSWTSGMTADDVQSALAPSSEPLTLEGTDLALTADNGVSSPTGDITIGLEVRPAAGGATDTIFFSPFPAGESTVATTSRLCAEGCEVIQLSVADSDLGDASDGDVAIVGLEVDGQQVDPSQLAPSAWREVPALEGSDSQLMDISGTDGRLTLGVSAPQSRLYAAVSPDDVPLARPILIGRGADLPLVERDGDTLVLASSNRVNLYADPVAETESMPILGPRAILVDYTMLTRDNRVQDPQTSVYVLSRADTPQSIQQELEKHGLHQMPSLAAVEHAIVPGRLRPGPQPLPGRRGGRRPAGSGGAGGQPAVQMPASGDEMPRRCGWSGSARRSIMRAVDRRVRGGARGRPGRWLSRRARCRSTSWCGPSRSGTPTATGTPRLARRPSTSGRVVTAAAGGTLAMGRPSRLVVGWPDGPRSSRGVDPARDRSLICGLTLVDRVARMARKEPLPFDPIEEAARQWAAALGGRRRDARRDQPDARAAARARRARRDAAAARADVRPLRGAGAADVLAARARCRWARWASGCRCTRRR